MKNIKIYIVLYLFSAAVNATVYDALLPDILNTTNMDMINVSYNPASNRSSFEVKVKQCHYKNTCNIGLNVRTSSFIKLQDSEIKHYILGDEYNFRFIQQSKNTAIVYTIDDNQSTNLLIIDNEDNVYPLQLSSNLIVNLIVELSNKEIQEPTKTINSTITIAGVEVGTITIIDATKTTPVIVTKTALIGTLSEYIDVDYVDEPLNYVLKQLLGGWNIHYQRGLDVNKIVSITAEKSSKLNRKEAIKKILDTFGYNARYFNQRHKVVISNKE